MGLKRLWFCLVSAAAFFVTYDCTKSLLGAGGPLAAPHVAPVAHMLAASLGEIVSPPALSSSGFIGVLFVRSPPLLHSSDPGLTVLFLVCLCVRARARFSVSIFLISLITMQSWHQGGVPAVGSELQLGASSGPSRSHYCLLICLLFQLSPPDSSIGVCGIQPCDQPRCSLHNPSHPNHSRAQILSHMGARSIHIKQDAPRLYHRGFLQNTGFSVFMDFGWMSFKFCMFMK